MPKAFESEMASGRIVQDILGYRPSFTVTYEYIPEHILVPVVGLIRQGGFFKVEYPTPTGAGEGMFKISDTSGQKIFKFVDNAPMWYGLTLTFTSQVVVNDD